MLKSSLQLVLLRALLSSLFLWGTSSGQSRNTEYFQYISPLPGSRMVSPHNNIIIRQGEVIERSSEITTDLITVNGSESGIHKGELILSDDSKTLVFNPERPFASGEIVEVELKGFEIIDRGKIGPLKFHFTISQTPKHVMPDLRERYMTELGGILNSTPVMAEDISGEETNPRINSSLPANFPEIAVNTYSNPTPGYLSMAMYFFTYPDSFGPTYLSIADNYGSPIFYRLVEGIGTDFKLQPNGLLTFYEGALFANNPDLQRFYAMDASYAIVDSFRTGNGYVTDLHELLILPNNHALLMSYDPQVVRMDTIVPGGDPNAIVDGLIIQELDAAKNVVFQWRSWDHFEITDADTNIDLTAAYIDYVHGNAIEVDRDGNLLISSRHLCEITKIDRQTGDVIWRWGGKKNQFTFSNDSRGFSYQHDIRVLDNGNYTLFDNGNYLNPLHSSALEYQLDEQNRTATLVWSYRDPNIFGGFMGSARRLANNNTLIGWGGTYPSITEVREDGSKELELTFETNWINYRAFRFPWETSLFSTDNFFINFGSRAQVPVDLPLTLLNNSANDIFITTASTRDSAFFVIDSLPILLPANSNVQITVSFAPENYGNYYDVLTLRADLGEEGFGRQVSLFGLYGLADLIHDENIPLAFALHQNYPNPFNPTTSIRYELPVNGRVILKIYNILGQEVRTLVNETQNAGKKSAVWDGRDNFGQEVSAGIYIYRIQAGDAEAGRQEVFVENRKMVLLR